MRRAGGNVLALRLGQACCDWLLTCLARYISNTSIIVGVRRRPLKTRELLQLTTCQGNCLGETSRPRFSASAVQRYALSGPSIRSQSSADHTLHICTRTAPAPVLTRAPSFSTAVRRFVEAPTTRSGPARSGWNPSYNTIRMRYVPRFAKGPADCTKTCDGRTLWVGVDEAKEAGGTPSA